ncbi:hypothetical protein FGB62_4g457 [Gracilaria domingensis]|nr:hypothetical protein FGB62_4g457 [Gracilaria domingensis]
MAVKLQDGVQPPQLSLPQGVPDVHLTVRRSGTHKPPARTELGADVERCLLVPRKHTRVAQIHVVYVVHVDGAVGSGRYQVRPGRVHIQRRQSVLPSSRRAVEPRLLAGPGCEEQVILIRATDLAEIPQLDLPVCCTRGEEVVGASGHRHQRGNTAANRALFLHPSPLGTGDGAGGARLGVGVRDVQHRHKIVFPRVAVVTVRGRPRVKHADATISRC